MALRRDRRADDERFAEFVDIASPGLLHTAWLLTGNHHASVELVQAALVKTYMAWSRVDPGTSVAYARRVLVNHAHDTWRRGSREVGVDSFFDDIQPGSSPMDAVDSRDLVVRLLADLPTRQREVVVLRHYCGMPEKEVAATLGIAEGTVKSHLSRGMAALRTTLVMEKEQS
ncbi:SigE family RNA polymerase sigma factor [Janibacter limosus]|uniref:SigE family RNA polymerase sigma factor n=1 Tax=Janibacter limosus TaxID=53458 RepID=A0A4P6MZL7_9MICO|nr:SigE family RNA polymerase sigma factor [Janibacter limosus]QBF47203.1 SigE family RNA polymerase sigma factor [Janibacter limosus]